jgi:hypothetical protein
LIIKEHKLGLLGWLIVFVLFLSSNGVSADSDSLESRLKEINSPESVKAKSSEKTVSIKKQKKKSVSKPKKAKKLAKRKRYKRACYQSSVKTLLDRAESLQPAIRNSSHRYGVSEALIISIITAESCFSRTARSPKNAQGLMQLIPATAKRFGVKNAFVPAQNIKGGTRYLKFLLKRFSGNLHLVIAAYNAGEGAVDRFSGIPPYRETREYVRRVMSVYLRIQNSKDAKPVVRQARYVDPVSSQGNAKKGNFIKPDFKWKRKASKQARVNNLYKVSSRSSRSVCRDVSSVKLKKSSWLVKQRNGMKRYYSSRKPKSLSSIAKVTGVNLSLLLRMNRNASKYMVKPGNKILVWQCANR